MDEQLAETAARRAMREEGIRECATCHKKSIQYWTSTRIKNCSDCREVNRRKHKLAEERKAHRQVIMTKMTQNTRKPQADDDDDDDDEVENLLTIPQVVSAPLILRPVHGSSQKTGNVYKPMTTKANASKAIPRTVVEDRPLKDLDDNEKNFAMEKMKQRLAATVKAKHASAVSIHKGGASRGPQGREYQTASALYESLRKGVQNHTAGQQKLYFQGFHAIVAIESIDNAKRIDMVTNDLRKIVRLPFDHTHPARSYDTNTHARTTSFRCTCLGYEVVRPQPLTLKGNPGDLIKMARHANNAISAPIPRLCGGKVTITAAEDKTHPLQVLGQRITVRVDHTC